MKTKSILALLLAVPLALVSCSNDVTGGGDSDKKAWRDIWSAGQGVGGVDEVLSTHALVDRIELEFNETRASVARA